MSVAWAVAVRYARLYGWVKDHLGFNLRGLGRVLRSVREDHTFMVAGQQFYFDHRIAGSYDRLIAGQSNEPETRRFLLHVLDALPVPVAFIDVGANLGEFVIAAARHPKVSQVWAFEPVPECARVVEQNAKLNGLGNVTVSRIVVGDGSARRFQTDPLNPNASAISQRGDVVQTLRLDDAVNLDHTPSILLIDVEGAEPLVLAGAVRLLAGRPLIIFEYNHVSRRHYNMDQIRDLLGESYAIHRLRQDARLDEDLEASWNCVAVPRASPFETICAPLVQR